MILKQKIVLRPRQKGLKLWGKHGENFMEGRCIARRRNGSLTV